MRLVARVFGVLLGLFSLGWLVFYEWFPLLFASIDPPPTKDTSWVLLVALLPILVGTVSVGLGRAWGAALIAAALGAVLLWKVALFWEDYEGRLIDLLALYSPPLLIPAVAAVVVAVVLSRTPRTHS